MRELNIEFLEQYKRLDKLCKDIFSSSEGVSSYILDMESKSYKEKQTVAHWDIIYNQLKHARHMRNKLAHEIDIDTKYCEQLDIDWIKQFYESILNQTDPLALLRKANQYVTPTTVALDNKVKTNSTIKEKPRKSLWNQIVSKIKKLFS